MSNNRSNGALSEIFRGAKAAIPIVLGFIPVGIAYAIMAANAGLNEAETIFMSVCVFASNTDGKISFIAMASQDAVKAGVHCGKIIKEITAIAGGSGGGKPDSAQGGGKEADKIAEALNKVETLIG